MEEQTGIAIIGSGYWGVNYVRVFNELPESQVRVVCDKNEERLKEVGRRFPTVQLVTSVEEAIAVPGVDAAVICTPAASHYDVANQLVEAGKHVLVEKPITTTVSDADALICRADQKGVVLMVGHTFLFNPGIIKMKELIDRGDAGRIYYLYARRTNLGPIRMDVNALWDLAPHDIAIFNYLMGGAPRWVSAVASNVLGNHREDVGFVTFGYQDNVIAHLHVSWADAYKVREVVAVGSQQRIVFNDYMSLERVRVFDKGVSLVEPEASSYGEFQMRMRDGDIYSPRVETSEPLKNQASHFLHCIQTGERPTSDGESGRLVVQIMEALDRSVQRMGTPVMIDNRGSNGHSNEYSNGHYHLETGTLR